MTVTEPVARRLTADDPRLAPWRAFLEAHARVSRRLDEDLRAEHDLSLAEYDALLNIAQAPDRRIRMRQLSDRVILSKSGVTRLIDRLVADGLVERSACLADARGAEAVLTESGLARLRSGFANPPARHQRALPGTDRGRRCRGHRSGHAGRCGECRAGHCPTVCPRRHGARRSRLTGRLRAVSPSGPAASRTRAGRPGSTPPVSRRTDSSRTTRRGSMLWS